MSSRPRSSPAPGSRGGRAGRRPRSAPPSSRRSARASSATGEPPTYPSKAKLTGRAAILVLVVAVLTVSYASSVRAWVHQRSEINSLTAEIAERKAEVAALEQAKQRWHDPAYIRTQARLRFGWLMPGETGFRVITENGDILASGSQLSRPVPARPKISREWWETAWGSVVEAGRTPAEVAAAAAREAARGPAPAAQIGGRRPGSAVGQDDTVVPGGRVVPDFGQRGAGR